MVDSQYYWDMSGSDRVTENMADSQYYWDMSDTDRVTEQMADRQYCRDMSDSDNDSDRLYSMTFVNEERIVVTKEQYALLKSVEVEDINAIRRYARMGGDLNIQFNNGATLLQIAIENGKISALQALLQFGANPDMTGIRVYRHLPKGSVPRSYTPMETAALCEQIEAIRLLFEYGANPDIVGEDGRTALFLAVYHGLEASTYILRGLPVPQLKCTWAHYRIMNAIHFSNEDELTRLLQDKIDPNFVTSDGCSPLFAAIENDFFKCLKILLDYGANANMLCRRTYPCEYVEGSEDPRKWTPLECAVIYDNIDYMLVLIAHGANVYYSDIDGKSALSTAYAYRRPAVIQFLENYIAGIHGPRESEILLKALDKRQQRHYDSSIEPEYLSEEPDQYKSITKPDGTHNWDVYEPWMDFHSGYKESPDSSVTLKIESKYKNLCDWWPYPLLDQEEISASCVTDDKNLQKAIEEIHSSEVFHESDNQEPHCSYTYSPTYTITHVGIDGSKVDGHGAQAESSEHEEEEEEDSVWDTEEEDEWDTEEEAVVVGVFVDDDDDDNDKGLKSGKGLKRKKIGKYLKTQEDETSEKPKKDEKYEHSEQAGNGGKDENVKEEKKDKKNKDHIEQKHFDWYKDWCTENQEKLRQEIDSPTDKESEEYEAQWILDTQSEEDVTNTEKETGEDKKLRLKTKLGDQEEKDVTEKKDDGMSDAQKTKYNEKGKEVQEKGQSTKETGITTKKEDSKIKPKPAHPGAVSKPDSEEEEWSTED